MIDLHNHIIYAFDDGPKDLPEAIEMLKIAAGQGITDICATSHFSELIRPQTENDYFSKLKVLREEADKANLGLLLHSGAEIMYHHYIVETVKKSRVGTLAGHGLYVLMEYPMILTPAGAEQAIFDLSMENFLPIIAHPERYSTVMEKPSRALKFIRHGGLLQVNTGSILGKFGKTVQKAAMWLLEEQLVHFIASDAHTPRGRTFKLAESAEYLKTHLDKTYIDQLVRYNPAAVVENRPLDSIELDEREQESSGLLSRFRKRILGT